MTIAKRCRSTQYINSEHRLIYLLKIKTQVQFHISFQNRSKAEISQTLLIFLRAYNGIFGNCIYPLRKSFEKGHHNYFCNDAGSVKKTFFFQILKLVFHRLIFKLLDVLSQTSKCLLSSNFKTDNYVRTKQIVFQTGRTK